MVDHRVKYRAKLALKDKSYTKNYVKLHLLIMLSDIPSLYCIAMPFPDIALYVVECQMSLTVSVRVFLQLQPKEGLSLQ